MIAINLCVEEPVRRFNARIIAGLATLTLALGMLATPAAANAPATTVGVIVQYEAGAAARVAHTVTGLGGHITAPLSLISGFAAELPERAMNALRGTPGVRGIARDSSLTFHSTDDNSDYQPAGDANSLPSLTKATGAQAAWSQGATGQGVGVALIDTGVVPVPGLTEAGKVINGPDLSFESQSVGHRYLDTYGHGTHLAGIIAGGNGVPDQPKADFTGVAPDAHLISLKVGAHDGAADVSQVIAAIDWVVTHRNDAGLNIRVLNLAFGTDSTQDPDLDPLSYAVDAAWRHGIVVVVAVGNNGQGSPVNMPAANPRIIAVGAVDSHGTNKRKDDTVATFSAANANRPADILAPGTHVASLRNPGSFLDEKFPGGRVNGATDLFRGSGTSQATAFVSGAAALLLQEQPDLTPDQVKWVLTHTTDTVRHKKTTYGTGQLNIGAAVDRVTHQNGQTIPSARAKGFTPTGLGSLEEARGNLHVQDPANGTQLTGEQDIFGQPWIPQIWAAKADQGEAWTGGMWNSSTWTGADWTGTSWGGTSWGGTSWGGTSWGGTSWGGTSWGGTSWGGTSWGGTSWGGTSWGGADWS